MVSLNDALMDMVTRKLVAPEEALNKAVDKAGFESLLKRVPAAPPDPRARPATVST
jgi:hypothetical protein